MVFGSLEYPVSKSNTILYTSTRAPSMNTALVIPGGDLRWAPTTTNWRLHFVTTRSALQFSVKMLHQFIAVSLFFCFQARSSAARTLLDVARQQTADTRGVAADAASAAAEAAVKSTMARFHEQQEQLLREREARLKSYRDRSRDERTRDSYSSYSASERTPDSYSKTRTSRTGTDAVDQAKGSPGSRSYASDDLDITKGSAQDRTAR